LGNFLPSFSAGSIYFADAEGNIKSIDIDTGKTNWTKQFNELASGTASSFGALAVADVDGNVILLNQEDGSKIWEVNVKGEVLAPTVIDAQLIIVKTGSGELLALDKLNGDVVWSYRSKLPALTIRGSSSPVVDGGQVYVSFDNGRLVVFDIETGFPLWDGAISYVKGSSELENLIDSDANPVVDAGYVYTTNYQGNLNIFDIAQKRSVWESEVSSFFSPVLLKGMMIVVESDSSIKSIFTKTLEDSWNSDEYLNRELSNPISFNGNIIVGDFEGYVHVIDPLNGKTLGRKKISKNPIKRLISRSKNFYVVDEEFNLFSLSI
ncbi:MAG: outer membrane protein assembly factor BamB, partial [Proteobacteria bacterium]|nr:outer membrane protein assembly factor BamB [Pseudomonadota bacterium]